MNRPMRILLVEDSHEDIRFTKEILSETGIPHELEVVDDGEKAITFLHKEGKYESADTPDVILLDLNMPRRTGHEVLADMRKHLHLASIPVILITVSDNDTDITSAMLLKMNYYIRKPVQVETLRALLATIDEFWLARN